jgi:hypothetical protein
LHLRVSLNFFVRRRETVDLVLEEMERGVERERAASTGAGEGKGEGEGEGEGAGDGEGEVWEGSNALGEPASVRPSTEPVLVAAQSLWKFHPDFDDVLRAVMTAPTAKAAAATTAAATTTTAAAAAALLPRLVIVASAGDSDDSGAWLALLAARLRRTLGAAVARRVVLLQPMPAGRLFGLLLGSAAVLDTLPFGGGLTVLEALGLCKVRAGVDAWCRDDTGGSMRFNQALTPNGPPPPPPPLPPPAAGGHACRCADSAAAGCWHAAQTRSRSGERAGGTRRTALRCHCAPAGV